jgi:pimeloyl-ACP methyl ester carboxylesterase
MWGAIGLQLAQQSDDLAAMAASLSGPLLVLVGEQDKPFVKASRLMADAIPDAQLVIIPDAGHSPQFENPRAWIDAITTFLSSLPTVAR